MLVAGLLLLREKSVCWRGRKVGRRREKEGSGIFIIGVQWCTYIIGVKNERWGFQVLGVSWMED